MHLDKLNWTNLILLNIFFKGSNLTRLWLVRRKWLACVWSKLWFHYSTATCHMTKSYTQGNWIYITSVIYTHLSWCGLPKAFKDWCMTAEWKSVIQFSSDCRTKPFKNLFFFLKCHQTSKGINFIIFRNTQANTVFECLVCGITASICACLHPVSDLPPQGAEPSQAGRRLLSIGAWPFASMLTETGWRHLLEILTQHWRRHDKPLRGQIINECLINWNVFHIYKYFWNSYFIASWELGRVLDWCTIWTKVCRHLTTATICAFWTISSGFSAPLLL